MKPETNPEVSVTQTLTWPLVEVVDDLGRAGEAEGPLETIEFPPPPQNGPVPANQPQKAPSDRAS